MCQRGHGRAVARASTSDHIWRFDMCMVRAQLLQPRSCACCVNELPLCSHNTAAAAVTHNNIMRCIPQHCSRCGIRQLQFQPALGAPPRTPTLFPAPARSLAPHLCNPLPDEGVLHLCHLLQPLLAPPSSRLHICSQRPGHLPQPQLQEGVAQGLAVISWHHTALTVHAADRAGSWRAHVELGTTGQVGQAI
jgi:hypothetical protein